MTNQPAPMTPADQTRAAIMTALAEIRAEIETLHTELAQIRAGLTAAAAQPAPAAAPAGPAETMLADTLICTIDDNGRRAYKLRGGRYSKNGVRVWPEVLATLIDHVEQVQPGPTAITPPVLVTVEMATRQGRADLGEDAAAVVTYARKVTGKA